MLEANKQALSMPLPQFYEGPTGNILRIDRIYCHRSRISYLYLAEGINQIKGKFYRASISMDTIRKRYRELCHLDERTDLIYRIHPCHMVDLPFDA